MTFIYLSIYIYQVPDPDKHRRKSNGAQTMTYPVNIFLTKFQYLVHSSWYPQFLTEGIYPAEATKVDEHAAKIKLPPKAVCFLNFCNVLSYWACNDLVRVFFKTYNYFDVYNTKATLTLHFRRLNFLPFLSLRIHQPH